MKTSTILGLGLCLALVQPVAASESGWRLIAATPDHGLQLAYTELYLFECGARDVKATQFGITGLTDIRTGKDIPDTPGAKVTPGAAWMSLFVDNDAEPEMHAAKAVPNAFKGWDMTIRLAKDDKNFRQMGRGGGVSLLNPGKTVPVVLHDEDH
ncbi:hypothetical protein HZY97_19615 [Sphingomonas sp. R-74633]|uniref:hypothetical protein n=1 Tax=Sphingomonas sp. R-74633 TaxID=2751188 RepID=UPI0015D0DC74|nr:hypothetical protein [Sphingomonas sp. R-74633]NYT42991.1 hypothetical protein [Sphingomonas sp. R-74633]